MTDLGWPEILIVVVIAMVLFGSKKMPEIARSVGRSMRIVKAELGGLRDDDTPAAPAPAVVPPVAVQPVVVELVAPARPVAEQPVVVEPVAPAAPVQGDVPTR